MKQIITFFIYGSIFVFIILSNLVISQRLPFAMQTIGTDSNLASIPLDEILSGGPPPQGIPALGFSGDWKKAASKSREPKFISSLEAAKWLDDKEPVIALVIGNQAKAYPLQILTWHEIVNDTLAGVPVAVSFCPLCNSALAFDRRIPLNEVQQKELVGLNNEIVFDSLDNDFLTAYVEQKRETVGIELKGLEVTFGVSGMLYNSNMLMFDTHSSTLWSQLLGEGVVGSLTEVTLLRLPAQIISFAEFKEAFPDSPILSRETGFDRSYGNNPYVGYDDIDSPAFLFRGVTDGRLPPKERIISIEKGTDIAAYPFTVLAEEKVVNDKINDEPIVLFWSDGTNSALDTRQIASSKDIGAVGVFSRNVNEQSLNFEWDGEVFTDKETASTWNLLGQAIAGELAGQNLKPIVHDNTLWFAWAAFKPETRIFEVDANSN